MRASILAIRPNRTSRFELNLKPGSTEIAVPFHSVKSCEVGNNLL